MTTVLRRSGTLLRLSHYRFAEPARFSRSSFLIAPSCHLSRCPPTRRGYATVNPGDPKPPNDSKKENRQSSTRSEAGQDVSPEVQKLDKAVKETRQELDKVKELMKGGNEQLYSDVRDKLEEILMESERLREKEVKNAEASNSLQQALESKQKKTVASGSKPAQGFQDLYKDASPLSKASDPSKKAPRDPSLSPLTDAEKQQFDYVIAMMTKAMPKSMVKEMERMSEQMKRDGIPKELREELTNLRNGAGFSLATATKLSRIIMKYTRAATDKAVESDQKQEQESESAKESTSGQKQQQRKSAQQGSFGKMDFKFDSNFFIISAFIAYVFYRMIMPSENSREITWQEFRTSFLDKGLVDKLTVINGNRVRVSVHREAVAQVHPESPAVHNNFFYYFTIGSVEGFEGRLEQAQQELGIPSAERIPVAYGRETALWDTLISFGPTLLLIGFFVLMGRSARGGAGGGTNIFSMGRSRAKKFNHETGVQIKFKDVAGMDEAKQEIMEFVSFLKEPGQYQRLGAKIPRGAILSGPPGTGKTLLAKATAGESNVPFFSVSGSEFVEMFVGVGASRVRDLFANARKSTPCIIFIDEIDAIGKSRGKNQFGGGNDEREATLNQILTEMDGFNTTEQVVVLAGTNRPDVLDKALMRPGRFDRHIAIDRPTMDGRKQIFKVHMREIITGEDMDYLCGRLAALTPGFSGADVANCVNEAALIAARGKADKVAMTHFEQAIERIIGGLEKKSLVLNPEEKRTVAYHEAGHAICGWFFKYADPLLKVSIIPRGQGALGYAQYLPAGDTYLMNVNQLMDRMAMTLAGRVSEELHFDTVTSGASDDFKKVTRMAAAMVTKFGMSTKIGYLYFEEEEQRLSKPFSEDTARNIDQEIRRIVDEAYKQCKALLIAKKKEIGIVAEELLRKEVLGRDDLIRLLGKRPFEDNGEFTKYFGAGKGSESTPPPSAGEILNPEPPPAPAMFEGMGVVETPRTSWGAREELFRRKE